MYTFPLGQYRDTMNPKTKMQYLTEEELTGFEKYKYNSIDTGILSVYVMHPFWNWCIKFCPKWVAPNLLTFSGFLLTVVNLILFSWYDYDFYGNSERNKNDDFIPKWIWALSSINFFVAYTLDGIDGKQARRTGTSGPLGELFDHGLDSYSAVLIPTCMYSIFGRHSISPLRMFFLIWNIFVNFFLTHWEKYNTGVLFLPWGYDFTMIGSVLLLSITSIIGPRGWDINLPGGITPGMIFEFVLYSSAMITSQSVILWNIYKSYRDKTGKMRSFSEAIRPLVPLFTFFVVSSSWAMFSPNNIIDKDPRAFYILAGTVFSNISCNLIVSQMSNTRCEICNPLVIPYAITTLVSILVPISANTELLILYSECFIATVTHIHYGICVVQDMCQHFNIRCFHIEST
ncbi:ethanolaminephosphotransferase 1 [Arctopsyche grandis]|uniref:ethanolaminephosphotransferase 1 n=1 Tax=Arctopsyche grandis TaxID=121162 RepID=UPI00406D89FF